MRIGLEQMRQQIRIPQLRIRQQIVLLALRLSQETVLFRIQLLALVAHAHFKHLVELVIDLQTLALITPRRRVRKNSFPSASPPASTHQAPPHPSSSASPSASA